jgi:hypothetical protein
MLQRWWYLEGKWKKNGIWFSFQPNRKVQGLISSAHHFVITDIRVVAGANQSEKNSNTVLHNRER